MSPRVASLEEVVCPQMYGDCCVVGFGGFLVSILQERGGLGELARLGSLPELDLRGSQVGGSLLLVSEEGKTPAFDGNVGHPLTDAGRLGSSVGRFYYTALC